MRLVLLAITLVLCGRPGIGQDNTSSGNAQEPTVAAEFEKVRAAMAAQQQQILAQQQQIERQQQEIEFLRTQLVPLPGAQANHEQAPQQVNASLTPSVALPGAGTVQGSADKPKESPLSFRIGGTEFTPGGFIDFENVFRTTNSGSIITTNFAAIPFSNTPQGHLTENRITAQFSRFNLKVSGKYGANDVTAYAEMDFNGNDATNIFVTANSHTFRERLAWLDLKRNKWEFIGGQTWSWITPNRRGVGALPSDLALTYDEDGNAQVGIPYTRAAEFRAIYHPNSHWAAGVGIENAEQYTGFGAGEVTLPTAFAALLAPQLDPTNTTNSTPNVSPDILSKIAYDSDSNSGRHFHAELTGLFTAVKTTIVTGAGFQGNSTIGGGFGGAFNFELFKNFRLLANGFYSDGGGRYLIGLAPSTVVRSDGSPSLVHSGTGLVGVEFQLTPKTQFGAYYGAMYAQRNFELDTSAGAKPNTFIGFGAPGSANTNNRAIQEPSFDWTQTFWRNPQYGAVQLVTQTSYLTRSPWFVPVGAPKNAHLVMVYTSLRYVLP
ncbi:MAG TPA: hypothetical protein VGJ33_05775 [Candidatus Angelobacter sp.]|jgi:hypothetical protein